LAVKQAVLKADIGQLQDWAQTVLAHEEPATLLAG
jgi:hypothetical protein